MRTKSGWEMVSMRLPREATDVLDELAKHLPAGPGNTPSRSVALIWALMWSIDGEGWYGLPHPDRMGLDRPLQALKDHVETLGLGLE